MIEELQNRLASGERNIGVKVRFKGQHDTVDRRLIAVDAIGIGTKIGGGRTIFSTWSEVAEIVTDD